MPHVLEISQSFRSSSINFIMFSRIYFSIPTFLHVPKSFLPSALHTFKLDIWKVPTDVILLKSAATHLSNTSDLF